MDKMSYDVIVVGGGTAGVVAAIQAARLGAKAALIEERGQLGGAITSGGVSAPAYFFSPLKQIIAGIGWELVTDSVKLDSGWLPDFHVRNQKRPSYHAPVNRYTYALVAEEKCLEAGVHIRYDQTPRSIQAVKNGWKVEIQGKQVDDALFAKEVVDCTGDAVVVHMAGFERIRENNPQPATLEFKLVNLNYPKDRVADIDAAWRRALETNALEPGDFCYEGSFTKFLDGGGSNIPHLFNVDGSTATAQTEANINGRSSLLRLLRFVRTLPGCENARIDYMADYTAMRDGPRIVGEKTVTKDDYLSGRRFDDAVCYSLYFIDVHYEGGTKHEFLPPEVVPTIPFGALIPKGSERLLVAGRSISSDKEAHSALRVQASCMAMGQAAGAAAALGAQRGTPSRQIPIDDLRGVLADQGAIVPN